ncbi:hypothetical protein IDG46_05840 [Staphylococcus sp. EG-SA-13]|nr:hypothetical protein [Staphylococcus sp. EG-SA-13]
MPTIKQKVDMTAHELITYGIQNNIKNIILEAINEECREKAIIHFDENAMPIVSRDVNIHHVFEVKVEEPITEDTVLPELVTRTIKGHYALWKKGSINSLKHITFNDVEAFYIPNDDLTMTLIWTKEKGLVE